MLRLLQLQYYYCVVLSVHQSIIVGYRGNVGRWVGFRPVALCGVFFFFRESIGSQNRETVGDICN